jgi:drug/metabolite transporter (DMT)-like permease
VDLFVFTAVLFGAACHAAWNAVIKVGLDPLPATTLITAGAGIIALVLLPFAGLPLLAAWPWVVASVIIHLLYFIGLSEAYRTGDLGQVYPLARGAAPLMTALATAFFIGEQVNLAGWVGIVILVCGVVLLSARGGRDFAKVDRRALGFALFTAVTICAYSVVDGMGARIAGNPHPYTLMMFAGNGVAMLIYAFARRGPALWPLMRPYWVSGAGGGALQLLSYGIAIWAMTLAPIALVAALRETSVLFGAAIAVVFLKEPVRPARLVAAALILFGLVPLRLG